MGWREVQYRNRLKAFVFMECPSIFTEEAHLRVNYLDSLCLVCMTVLHRMNQLEISLEVSAKKKRKSKMTRCVMMGKARGGARDSGCRETKRSCGSDDLPPTSVREREGSMWRTSVALLGAAKINICLRQHVFVSLALLG